MYWQIYNKGAFIVYQAIALRVTLSPASTIHPLWVTILHVQYYNSLSEGICILDSGDMLCKIVRSNAGVERTPFATLSSIVHEPSCREDRFYFIPVAEPSKYENVALHGICTVVHPGNGPVNSWNRAYAIRKVLQQQVRFVGDLYDMVCAPRIFLVDRVRINILLIAF